MTTKRMLAICSLLMAVPMVLGDVDELPTVDRLAQAWETSTLPPAYVDRLAGDATRYAAAKPDLATIDALVTGMPFGLPIFERTYQAVFTRKPGLRNGRMSGRGELLDTPDGQFAMARIGDHMAMSIRIPSENLFFMIRSIGNGEHVLLQLEDSERDGCDGGHDGVDVDHDDHGHHDHEHHDPDDILPPGPQLDPLGGGFGTRSCVAPDPTWDILVAYTPSARAAAALAEGAASTNHGPIQALILLYVEEANLTFENSQILARMRLVHMSEVSYANGTSFSDTLDDMIDGTGGLGVVQTLREQYYADTAMLMVDDTGGGCGRAYCCPASNAAWGASRWDCWGVTFTHEFGHNLGCAHDPNNVDCGGCNSASRGHYYVGNDQAQYGTIMSYVGQNFWHFSNPNVSFQGQPTGITGQRDNVATINSRRFTVENFRASHFEVWVDPAQVGIGGGSFANPYSLIDFGQLYLIESDTASELPTMYIKTSTTNQTPTLTRPMTVRACGGMVTIGQQ